MQSVLQGTMQKASEAVADALSSNAKTADLKKDIREQMKDDRLTSDFGVKTTNTDVWLSTSTGDKKGPLLLEDNFAREKVCIGAASILTDISPICSHRRLAIG